MVLLESAAGQTSGTRPTVLLSRDQTETQMSILTRFFIHPSIYLSHQAYVCVKRISFLPRTMLSVLYTTRNSLSGCTVHTIVQCAAWVWNCESSSASSSRRHPLKHEGCLTSHCHSLWSLVNSVVRCMTIIGFVLSRDDLLSCDSLFSVCVVYSL